MQVREIEVKSGDIPLFGTLTTPDGAGPHPLVICIHGSGSLDRDANARFLKLNIFNDMAAYLAARGFACFRYDKRGVARSRGHYKSAGHGDLVADAVAVTRHFSGTPAFSKLYLLGHSEGTLIAPQVARACPVAGLVLLCPFVTPLEDLLAGQAREMQKTIDGTKGFTGWISRLFLRMTGGVAGMNRSLIRRVRQTTKPVLWFMLRRVEARWMREMLEIDPAEIMESINVPALVLVAGADVQCPPRDGREIAQMIGDNARHTEIAGLSHMLRIEGEAKGFAGYREQLKRPVAKEVLGAVGAWFGRG